MTSPCPRPPISDHRNCHTLLNYLRQEEKQETSSIVAHLAVPCTTTHSHSSPSLPPLPNNKRSVETARGTLRNPPPSAEPQIALSCTEKGTRNKAVLPPRTVLPATASCWVAASSHVGPPAHDLTAWRWRQPGLRGQPQPTPSHGDVRLRHVASQRRPRWRRRPCAAQSREGSCGIAGSGRSSSHGCRYCSWSFWPTMPRHRRGA